MGTYRKVLPMLSPRAPPLTTTLTIGAVYCVDWAFVPQLLFGTGYDNDGYYDNYDNDDNHNNKSDVLDIISIGIWSEIDKGEERRPYPLRTPPVPI